MADLIEYIKILVVDDHQIMINGIKSLLVHEKGVKIVGEINSSAEALKFLKKYPVDIVITDITMPEMSGIELTKIIRKEYPAIKVLVLTMHEESQYIKAIIDADASGYILKNISEKELIEAIFKVAAGKKYYSEEVFQTIVKGFGSRKEEENTLLTSREMEILMLISKSYSNQKIAEHLFISEHTVEAHRRNIFRKTNTKGVIELITFAHKNNLLSRF